MISQFYILSLRGDTIITRDFRGDVVKGTAEIFFRKVKFWHGDAPPIFNLDGVTYVFIKKNGLYFVATTCHNISPAAVVELLTKMAKVFKDFCGMLNEESIRKNFVLVYELLDEMVDFGYPQTTNTEHLKSCIHNEAVVIEAPKLGLNLPQWNPRTVPSNAVHRPVGPTHDAKNKKNEIFVDILERISVLMSSNGFVINSAIDGSIQMKSYLMGNPELKLALNEDIVVKNMDLGGSHGGYGSVILDDCNFHECVDLQDFSDLRTLSFYPPDGEFAVMNYRITGDFRVPFRIFPFAEQQTPHKLEITIKVRADIPESNYGGNVQISCMIVRRDLSAHAAGIESYATNRHGDGSSNWSKFLAAAASIAQPLLLAMASCFAGLTWALLGLAAATESCSSTAGSLMLQARQGLHKHAMSEVVTASMGLWTDDASAFQGGSCEYASASQGGLHKYLESRAVCLANPVIYGNGVACGSCWKAQREGQGSMVVQIIGSHGGSNNLDCFFDAFSTITGADAGTFEVSLEPVECEVNGAGPVATVVDGDNAWYTRAIFSNLPHAVLAASISVDGKATEMRRISGATWEANLGG
ncbi:AP4M, partial [Symbiodinium sp. CCMP2456]